MRGVNVMSRAHETRSTGRLPLFPSSQCAGTVIDYRSGVPHHRESMDRCIDWRFLSRRFTAAFHGVMISGLRRCEKFRIAVVGTALRPRGKRFGVKLFDDAPLMPAGHLADAKPSMATCKIGCAWSVARAASSCVGDDCGGQGR